MSSPYEIPAYGSKGSDILSWMLQAVSDGETWLRTQRPQLEWAAIRAVLGPLYDGGLGSPEGQSGTGFNLLRYIFSSNRATISNFKHAGEIVPTEDDAQELFDRAHMLTNLDQHWERTNFSNLTIRDGVGLGLAYGTGYIYEDWDKSRWGPGRGDIRQRAVSPNDVTFVQMPSTNDIQQAYVVLIKESIPLQLARRMYASNPTFAMALVADGDSMANLRQLQPASEPTGSPLLALAGTGGWKKDQHGTPTVDIWHAYTLDGQINPHGDAIRMGAVGTNWSYRVPALGDPIPQGIINPATGSQWTLPATADECMMFPLRRLTVFSRTGIAYDGSSPWWHGEVPLARIRFNDLPWETLGASQIGDAKTMQDGIVALMRIIENSAAVRMNPPKVFDDKVDEAKGKAFNTSKAGVSMQYDLTNGEPFSFPVPPQYYDVPQWIGGEGGYIRQQEDRMEKVTSARDLVAVAKAQQIPSSDTMEKLMEMAGPIVQDMVGALIKPLTQLGEWRKAYYFQFYTRPRMLRISDPTGEELLTNVKYTPEKIVPLVAGETSDDRTKRTRAYLNDFRYDVTESGVSELGRMSQLLTYIQLSKSGALPISWWTMAKVARVPNYGPPPAGTNTEMERVMAQRHIEAEMQIELAKELQAAQGGIAPPPEPSPESGGQEGRPPSFQKPATIVNKPSEGRSTISTS